jgi:hypothetical protein
MIPTDEYALRRLGFSSKASMLQHIISHLPPQSADRFMQSHGRSMAKECDVADISTLPLHMLLPCSWYSKHVGNTLLYDRIHKNRLERSDRPERRHKAEHKEEAREVYAELARVDGTINLHRFAQYEQDLNGERHPYHHVQATLRGMFAGRPELIAVIPYLMLDRHWRQLAKLLVGRHLEGHVKESYKQAKFTSDYIRAAERFLRMHSDAANVAFASQFTKPDVPILMDAIRRLPGGVRKWMSRVPQLVDNMSDGEVQALAARFFSGLQLESVHKQYMHPDDVAEFEALVDKRKELRQSAFARYLRESLPRYYDLDNAIQRKLYDRVVNALTPWSGVRRAWIETARAASAAAHGDSAPHMLPVD